MTPTPLVGSKSDRPGQPEREAKEGGSKWRDKEEKDGSEFSFVSVARRSGFGIDKK